MALLYLLAGAARLMARGRRRPRRRRSARSSPTSRSPRAWLVDPASGREGPGEIVVTDGVLESVVWLDDDEAERRRRPRGRRGARVHRPPRPLPRAGQRGRRDGRVRARRGGPRRVHDGLPDAEHDAGARRSGRARAGPRPRRSRPGRRSGRSRTARCRPVGRARRWRRSASWPTPASSGSRTTARRSAPASSLRNALAYAGALGLPIVDHPEDATLTAGAEANDGFVATVLGLRGWPAAAEEAAVARDLAILAEVVRDVPGARLHLTHLSTGGALELVRRAKAAGLPVTCDVTPHHLALTDEWLAGARRWAWEASGDPWARRRRSWPRRTRRRSASTRRCARRRTRPPAARRWSTGPPTRSRPTTRRTPRSTRTSSSGWRRTGSAGSRRRSGVVLAAVDAGLIPLQRAIEALTAGPARVLGVGVRRASGRPRRGRAGGPRRVRSVGGVGRDAGGAPRRGARTRRSSGSELPGRVLLTVAGGRLAYEAPGD